jgi:hypothetical protein
MYKNRDTRIPGAAKGRFGWFSTFLGPVQLFVQLGRVPFGVMYKNLDTRILASECGERSLGRFSSFLGRVQLLAQLR